MAIEQNSAIEYFGTRATVSAGGGTSAVTADQFSVAADAQTWTNTDDAPLAALLFKGSFATPPVFGDTIGVYARLMDVDSTNDAVEPGSGATDGNSHVFLGSFPVEPTTSTQRIPLEVSLPNMYSQQVYTFYIRVNSPDNLSAGWVLEITPKAFGPAP